MALVGAGDALRLAVDAGAASAAELPVLGGVPLDEPVARYGPFVMNTCDEILQAMRDYQEGRMGKIDF